eukprot:6214196-Pleurochrysis_carterae.AAC.3
MLYPLDIALHIADESRRTSQQTYITADVMSANLHDYLQLNWRLPRALVITTTRVISAEPGGGWTGGASGFEAVSTLSELYIKRQIYFPGDIPVFQHLDMTSHVSSGAILRAKPLVPRMIDALRILLKKLLRETPSLVLNILEIAFAPSLRIRQLALVSALQLLSHLIKRTVQVCCRTRGKALVAQTV